MMTKDQATDYANQLAKELGSGWKPYIWENLGWHFRAVSDCRRWKVHGNVFSDGIISYTAFLSPAGDWGGIVADTGLTPQKAVSNTRAVAMARIKELTDLLDLTVSPAPVSTHVAKADFVYYEESWARLTPSRE